MRNKKFNDTAKTNSTQESDYQAPDFIAMQYRHVRLDDGWKTRKERIGAAYENDNGAICFRPAGRQVIENDIYLFPNEPV